MQSERREFQRLTLERPLPATLGPARVLLIEIGVLGARVQHQEQGEDYIANLGFNFDGDDIELRCAVVRTATSQRTPGEFESGLRFVSAVGRSGDYLRRMLSVLVGREFDARRGSSPAMAFSPPIDGDRTIRGRDAGFLLFRLDSGAWHKRHVFLPEQPAAGFTVASNYDSEEIERLCRLYQASDEEGRRLIRMFAELSVSESMQIPPVV